MINYVYLLLKRRSPYYEIALQIVRDMEFHYNKAGQSFSIYTINPRILEEEIKKKIKSEKLTTRNVCRTILALFHIANLKEGKDFYVTTTSSGRRNYHVVLTKETINLLWQPLLI